MMAGHRRIPRVRETGAGGEQLEWQRPNNSARDDLTDSTSIPLSILIQSLGLMEPAKHTSHSLAALR
jgi:hypothetical protein